MFRAFNLSSKYGRSKAEKILLTYQTFAISVKVPTPYTTQPPCHNCVAILGGNGVIQNVGTDVSEKHFTTKSVSALHPILPVYFNILSPGIGTYSNCAFYLK